MPDQRPEPCRQPQSTSYKRVVLIDDNEVDQMLASRTLAATRTVDELICFTDPAEALSYLIACGDPKIDLILLDVHMPRMSGVEFLTELGKTHVDGCHPPVLVMISSPLTASQDNAFQSNIFVKGYVAKPLNKAAFTNTGASGFENPVPGKFLQ